MQHLLNVNDNVVSRYLATRTLRGAGYEVTDAASAAEALGLVRTSAFDLVLLDVKLPDQDGRDVCRALKADPLTAGIPVLLVSASFVDSGDRVDGFHAGADGYLSLPFEPEELVAQVGALLRAKRAERAAQEALRARDEFLSAASHELRTPLTTLSLQVARLERAAASGVVPRAEDLAGRISAVRRQVDRLTLLVDRLLDISRLVANRLELEAEEFDLAALARDVVEALAEQARGAAVEVHADPEVRGAWDRLRLEQVLTNLVSNALKYGEGRLVVVEVRATAEGARIIVRDQGLGIEPEAQERIFQRFERAVSGRSHSGIGLGLWIVRELVEAHGGSIRVDSRLGQGSVFTVDLPREAARAAPENRTVARPG